MKKLVLGLVLLLGCVDNSVVGMKKSRSTDDFGCKKLVVYGDSQIEGQRRMSEPVTRTEKDEAKSRVISVSKFLEMPENETQEYESVEFAHVIIDERFAASFAWKLKDSVNLVLDCCTCAKGTTYKDLFASTDVANLRINSCGLTNDEAVYIVRNLYPWTLESVTFTNEPYVNKKLVVDAVTLDGTTTLRALKFE